MFDLLKKLKAKRAEEKKEKEEKKQQLNENSVIHKQAGTNNLYRGMYCPSCGYMSVNTESNELPLEGFALCPNCGDHLKTGWFLKNADGFALVEKPDDLITAKKKVTGGHHRVRHPGPNRSYTRGHFSN